VRTIVERAGSRRVNNLKVAPSGRTWHGLARQADRKLTRSGRFAAGSCGNLLKQVLFDFVLDNARRGSLIRESVKSEYIRWMALARRLTLELGERFHRRGLLESAADVFLLRH
jgi:hypothetical protein